MRRTIIVVGACAGVAPLLSGCGWGGGDEPAEPTPAPTPLPECTVPKADEVCPAGPPGTAGGVCPQSGCCPGVAATGGKTFPCPNADIANFGNCEVGMEGMIDALLAGMCRQQKYNYLRGTGWDGEWDPQWGYYVGNAAIGLPFGLPSQNMQDNGNGFRNDYMTRESKRTRGETPEDKPDCSDAPGTPGELLCYPEGNPRHNPNGYLIDKEQVTSFPVSLAIASSWGEDEMSRFGTELGKEFRRKGVNVLLGPAVNVHRIPRNGRNAEYMSGESGYFGARLIKKYIKAVQAEKVLCSVKHFINNNQEACRRTSNSIVDARTRREVYYPPFEAAVQADVAIQMCGYNYVNGVANCASKEILVDDLKVELGFKGWVQSDWWAVYSFDVVNAGIDQEMPGTPAPDATNYPALFNDENLNTLTDEKVNSMVRPQMTYMAKYGLFMPGSDVCQAGGECDKLYYNTDVRTDESEALSRELATKAITLLKNDAFQSGKSLPLSTSTGKILLLGKACDHPADVMTQLAFWENNNYYHIGGSGKVITKQPISILKGFQDMCALQNYACTVVHHNSDNATEALDMVASESPAVAIMCGGVSAGENRDRENLKINEEDFVNEVAAGITDASINKIVLTMTCGTIVMPWIDNVHAMVNVFLPGKFAGPAFADILFGVKEPGARSPISYPKDEADTQPPCDCKGEDKAIDGSPVSNCEYTEKLTFAWYGMTQAQLLYPFGYGLTYTEFTYGVPAQYNTASDVTTHCPNQDADKGAAIICVTVEVTNSGSRKGVEVPQLYLKYPDVAVEPPRVLRGFQRLAELAPGAKATAAFPLYVRDLQIYNEANKAWERPAATAQDPFKITVAKASWNDPNEQTQDLVLPTSTVESFV